MLDILRVALPKEQLLKLSASERSLFLLLGYSSNQINALWKLVIVATNEVSKDPVEAKVTGAQTQIFVRLLIGIMREALKLIEKRFLGSKLGKEYVPLLSLEAMAAASAFFMSSEQFCTDSHCQWVLNEDKWRSLTPSHEMSGE
jgi:hypothetical protein